MRDEWSETKLGDVVSFEYGKALKESDRDGVGFPVYGSAGVVGRHSKPLVPEGPVIIVGRKGTAGSVHWSEEPCSPIDTTYFVRTLVSVDLGFVYLLLQLVNLPEICAQTGVPGLNRDRAYEVPVLVPPIDEQRRIVDLIAAVDYVVESAQLLADRLDIIPGALLHEATEGVERVPLIEAVSLARAGGTPSRKRPDLYGGGIPWLKSGEVNNPWIDHTDESITDEALRESAAWLAPAGATVIAMYGATAGQVGRLGKPMATNQAVLAIQSNGLADDGFLFHWLRSRTPSMKARAVGAAQPNLSKERALEELVPLPSLDRQREIASALDALVSLRTGAELMTRRLIELRFAFLSDLLRGEHEIPSSYDQLLSA